MWPLSSIWCEPTWTYPFIMEEGIQFQPLSTIYHHDFGSQKRIPTTEWEKSENRNIPTMRFALSVPLDASEQSRPFSMADCNLKLHPNAPTRGKFEKTWWHLGCTQDSCAHSGALKRWGPTMHTLKIQHLHQLGERDNYHQLHQIPRLSPHASFQKPPRKILLGPLHHLHRVCLLVYPMCSPKCTHRNCYDDPNKFGAGLFACNQWQSLKIYFGVTKNKNKISWRANVKIAKIFYKIEGFFWNFKGVWILKNFKKSIAKVAKKWGNNGEEL